MVLRRLEEISIPTIVKIKKVIDDSPAKLEDLYRALIDETFKKDPEFTLILAWMTFARQPLRLKELEVAISVGMLEKRSCWQDCLGHKVKLSRGITTHAGTVIDSGSLCVLWYVSLLLREGG
jgi:hypothetical protein